MENFKEIENKWKKFWEENPELYKADNNSKKTKKYILNEFPYPSGSGLHVGHAFSFTGGDVYARFKRMQGENVLFPMGWDAFGLPTENYAIKMKKKPQQVTKENTDMFRQQMKDLAFSFDWDREVNTTDPNYYKWTQWIFIQLFNKGLAYKKEMPINWCPSCKIGLANEEVVDGKCERCGTGVSRRNISQWVVKITEYADKLIEGLKETDFIDKVKQAQINWIGKSEGAKIKFLISNDKCPIKELEVFTTRPDTLFGATFMVIAPEHPLISQLLETHHDASLQKDIETYVINARKKSELERTELSKDKTGVFSGLYAINPVNNKEIPIWISDFVLASYGTGAIMSVPAHDERDFAFAKKFGLEIINVYDKKNNKAINSEFLNGLTKEEAIEKIIKWLEEKGIGKREASYHLRDWIFSRQHYWGEPIPMINCSKCGWVSEKESNLPVVLPEVEAYEPTDDGQSPLSQMTDWIKTTCPRCGGEATRETDTMPNWAGSDWYFLRYMDAHNDTEIASSKLIKYWGPVDIYIGGDEHNVLHLLYSRFIYKFLWDIGAVPKELPEPYYKRLSHGVILGPDGQRMSKSKGNVIIPGVVSDKYGVDVVRMYLMFMGPFDATMAWNEKTLMGVKRFTDRFDKLIHEIENDIFGAKHFIVNENEYPQFLGILNKTIKKVSEDIEQFKYNTAIASIMELINMINSLRVSEVINNPNGQKHRQYLVPSMESVKKIIKLIAPFAPYTAEELYFKVETHHDASLQNNYTSVHMTEWPKADPKYLIEEETTIMLAINGKVRSELKIKTDEINNKDLILALTRKDEKIIRWIGTSKITKEIYIVGKMVNLVLRQAQDK